MHERTDDRSLGELIGDLSRQLTTLVHSEIELARTEMTQNVSTMIRSSGLLAAGGVVAYAGGLVLLAAVVLLLIQVGLDPWLAAFVVGAVVLIVGLGLVVAGRQALSEASLTPDRTIQTLKEDAELARERSR